MGYLRMTLTRVIEESLDLAAKDNRLKEIVNSVAELAVVEDNAWFLGKSTVKLLDALIEVKDNLDVESLCDELKKSIISYLKGKGESIPHSLRFTLDAYRSCEFVEKSKATKLNVKNKLNASLAELLRVLFTHEEGTDFDIEYHTGRSLYYLDFYLKEMK